MTPQWSKRCKSFQIKLCECYHDLPLLVHFTQCATLAVAESSVIEVAESASQTGVVDVISQPSAYPEISPHTLHAPVERHLYVL